MSGRATGDGELDTAEINASDVTANELLEDVVLRFGGEPETGASRPRLMASL